MRKSNSKLTQKERNKIQYEKNKARRIRLREALRSGIEHFKEELAVIQKNRRKEKEAL